jgi:serine protease Do
MAEGCSRPAPSGRPAPGKDAGPNAVLGLAGDAGAFSLGTPIRADRAAQLQRTGLTYFRARLIHGGASPRRPSGAAATNWSVPDPALTARALRDNGISPPMRTFVPVAVWLGLALAVASRLPGQELTPVEPPPEFNPATEPAVVAVAKVLPAVVNISTERIVRRTVQDPFEDFYEQFFNAPSNRRPRQLEQKIQSLGSGFLIDADGDIVTNQHVVERAADLKIQVTFADGTSCPARYVAGDDKADLALIHIERKDRTKPFPYINLNNVSPNLLGETVLVLGNPLGYNSSVSRGILSANEREITIDDVSYKHLLQTDAAINPGNSGGPLIDLAGRLVGISSVKLAFTPQGTPTQGLGFAIPASTVAAKVAEFRADAADPAAAARRANAAAAAAGDSPNARRLFGLHLQTLTPDLARALKVHNAPGVVITDVDDGSPAADAGLRQGLVIYRIGTYNAPSSQRVEALLNHVAAGTSVDFVIGAGGEFATVTLVARE